MKTAICYFSGTGNTKRTADAWLRALSGEGMSSEAFRIDYGRMPDLRSFDRIGIFYPIHAFNAPEIVLKFAENLPVFPQEKVFFVVMVSGEPLRLNHSSDQKLRRILRKKNARVESAWHYVMPYNMIFRHTEEQAFRMDQTMQALVPLHVRAYFTEGRCHELPRLWGMGWIIAVLRIEQWFSHKNGKHYRVTEECVQCGKCVENCPAGNIRLADGKIHFGEECLLCTRCSFSCPKDAIRIGLLDGWRVNGPYRFRKPEQEEPDRHARFLRRAYTRYFREAQERLDERGGEEHEALRDTED